MALRLYTQYRNVYNVLYRIEIHDRESEVDEEWYFDTLVPGARIIWEGDDRDFYKRVVPMKCTFAMILNSPDSSTEGHAAILDFYNDLTSSEEGRFLVKVIEGENSPNLRRNVSFIGKILIDVTDLNLAPVREMQLTAICGLSDLKEVEYRPPGISDTAPAEYFAPIRITDHIIDILKRNDVVTYFYDDTMALLLTFARWRESNYAVGQDPFYRTYMRNHWWTQENRVYRKYHNCLAVLEELMEGFNARLFYSQGMFRVEQLSSKKNLTPVSIKRYKMDGTLFSSDLPVNIVDFDYDDDDNLHLIAYPSMRHLAPFKSVELTRAFEFVNYLKDYRYASIYNTDPSLDYLYLGPDDLGVVIATGSNRIVIDLVLMVHRKRFNWLQSISPDLTRKVWIEFEIKVKLNDWYLSNDEYINLIGSGAELALDGRKIPDVEGVWTLDSAERVKFRLQVNNLLALPTLPENYWGQNKFVSNFLIFSEILPEDGNIEIEITHVGFAHGTPYSQQPDTFVSVPREDFDWEWTPQTRLILAENPEDVYDQSVDISIFEINNLKNKINYQLKFSFYDSPDRWLYKQMFYEDGGFLPTEEWIDIDAGTLPLHLMALKEVLAMRADPVTVYNGVFVHTTYGRSIHFNDRVIILTDLYLPLRMEISTGSGEISGSWFQIRSNFDPITSRPIPGDDPEIPDLPTPFFQPQMMPAPGFEVFYFDFENVSADHVILPVDISFYIDFNDDLPNKQKFQVFVNGVKQRYMAHPTTLNQGSYNFGPDNDRIKFFRALSNAYVEVYIYP